MTKKIVKNNKETEKVFKLLYNPGEIIELRPLKPDWKGGGAGLSEFIKFNGDISDKITKYIQRNNTDYNLYFGVIPRGKKGEKSKVSRVNACFFDMDKKDFPSEEEFKKQIQWIERKFLPSVKLKYTAKVDTGHGFHYYFIFSPDEKLPIDKENNTCDAWKEIQCAFIELCQSDINIKDLPRIMRIPGSKNIKEKDDFKDCKIVDLQEENIYKYSDFSLLLKKYRERKKEEGKIKKISQKFEEYDQENREKYVSTVLQVLKEKGQGSFDDYNDFLRFCMGCKEEGLPYEAIDGILKQSKNYDYDENVKLYENLKPREITFGTVYDYAEKADEQRLKELLEGFDIRPAKKINPLSPKRKCKKEIFLEAKKYLKSKYELKRNVITQKIEISVENSNEVKELDDPFLSKIYFDLFNNNMELNKQDLQLLLINPDFVKEYDPLYDFIENIPDPQDKDIDYIKNFTDCIALTYEKERKFFQKNFKKWFVGMMTGVYPNKFCNHLMLILIGKQGIGKGTLLNSLIPEELKKYLQEQGVLKEDDKDTKISLSTHLLMNVDELESFKKKDVDSLKSLITAKHFDLRMPYDHFSRKFKKRASFMGSTNKNNFLTDITGSRRFLIFEIDSINFEPINNELIKNMYWQARELYKSGFKFYIEEKGIELLNRRNERFSQEDYINELVLKYLKPDYKLKQTDKIELMTTSEIATYLLNQEDLGDSSLNNRDWTIRKLGGYLRKYDFKRKCIKGIYKYAVIKETFEEKAEEVLDF